MEKKGEKERRRVLDGEEGCGIENKGRERGEGRGREETGEGERRRV